MDLGTRIKARRIELGMTQKELAKRIGTSEATVSRYESGEIQNLKHETLVDLIKVLDTTPGYLMGWNKPEPRQYQQYDDPRLNVVFDAWQHMSETDRQFIADLVKKIQSEDVDT